MTRLIILYRKIRFLNIMLREHTISSDIYFLVCSFCINLYRKIRYLVPGMDQACFFICAKYSEYSLQLRTTFCLWNFGIWPLESQKLINCPFKYHGQKVVQMLKMKAQSVLGKSYGLFFWLFICLKRNSLFVVSITITQIKFCRVP
jgi:hypothetical protein